MKPLRSVNSVSLVSLFNLPRGFACLLVSVAVMSAGFASIGFAQTPTVTTLKLSTSAAITPGTLVKLTATVTSGGTAVSPGVVIFCNVALPHCEDSAILGKAQLTGSGTASMQWFPGIGTYSIEAIFQGVHHTSPDSPNLRAASSSAPSPLTVQAPGKVASAISLSDSPSGTTQQFIADLSEPARPRATGSISFMDLDDGSSSFGTFPLTAGTDGLLLTKSAEVIPDHSAHFGGFASADFNGDGKQDLAIAYDLSVGILLGAGNGTFTSAPTLTPGGSAGAIAIADFNGDGILDIAVGNSGEIFLGVGDGTFVAKGTFPDFAATSSVISADFNRDGKADLAVFNTAACTVTIAIGAGDGTFPTSRTVDVSGGTSYNCLPATLPMTVGDFNGDGIPDLVTAVSDETRYAEVDLLLGVGDGTFTSTFVPTTLAYPVGIVTADFNGDGIADLALSDGERNEVFTLLGDGKGSFNALAPLKLSTSQASVGALFTQDFNGDGIADLATAGNGDVVPILFGKGDGTFTEAFSPAPFIPDFNTQLVLTDLNGDGVPDIVSDAGPGFIAFLSTNQIDLPLNVTLSGGSHSIEASYSGDSFYLPSVSAPVAVQNVTDPPLIFPGSGTYASPTTITITDRTPGAVISYQIGATDATLGPVQLYTGAFQIESTSPNAQLEVVASAIAPGYLKSAVVSRSYPYSEPTITTLHLNTGPSTPFGSHVTLSAHVTAAGVAFHNGYINFCNADVAECQGPALLASAVLGPGGWAVVHLRLGVGVYSIRADFQPVTDFAGGFMPASDPPPSAGSSSAPQTLTIVGKSTTEMLLPSAQAVGGTYTLSSAVQAFGRPPISGTVKFHDSFNGGTPIYLGAATVSAANTSYSFAPSAPAATGSDPVSTAVADFNADGLPDLVVANTDDKTLSILLANGDGTFKSQSTIALDGAPTFVAANDLSYPGRGPDLIVTFPSASSYPNSSLVEEFYGKPGGGFSYPQPVPTAADPGFTLVADLDGDGFPEFVTAFPQSNMLLVDSLYNVSFPYNVALPASPISLAVADLNNDQVKDLVVSNADGTVSVLLGAGVNMVTFGSAGFIAAPTLTPGASGPIVTGDFNRDGIPDIAVPGSSGIAIYLGKGDGTFTSAPSLPATAVTGLNITDLNGDGILDLAVTKTANDKPEVVTYLGKGDGTFPTSTTPVTASFSASTVVADFNGDGIPDLAGLNPASNQADVLRGVAVTPASITGISLKPGTHVITPSYLGTTTLAPSTGPPLTLVIPPA